MTETKDGESGRIFLVVADRTEESHTALRYAADRAKNSGGRVALVTVVEPVEFQNFMGVGDLIKNEAMENGRQLLEENATQVRSLTHRMPMLFLRDGDKTEEVMALIEEEPAIKILVLASGKDSDNPGPLVSALAGKFSHKLRIPVTVVPGGLSDEEIDALT